MVAMGRALMSKPKLLLLDEPSAGLSPLYMQQVFEHVQRIKASEQDANTHIFVTGVPILSGWVLAHVWEIFAFILGSVTLIFLLLTALGSCDKPVLLKRGMAAQVKELLLAAEYVVSEGNPNVILCERGIRGFDTATRNTFDLAAIPVLKRETHLPVFADP